MGEGVAALLAEAEGGLMVSLFRRKGDVHYTLAWIDPKTGRRRERTAYRDKRASQQLAAQIQEQLELGQAGLLDPFLEHRARPMVEHVDAFVEHLQSRGRSAKHIRQQSARVRTALAGMGASTLGSIDPAAVDRFLAALRNSGRSAKTRDDYAAALRQFGGWLVDAARWGANPFARLGPTRTAADVTFERRALTIDELRLLIAAAPQRALQSYVTRYPACSERTRAKRLRAGERRAVLYAFAAFTGLRANECRLLRWDDLELDGDPAVVRVRAATAKNRRTEFVPLHRDLIELLRTEREREATHMGRPVRGSDRVVHVPRWIVLLLRADAAWAGIGDDETGRRLDFHCLRVTAATMLARSGASVQQAQRVLRHSDPRITARLYTKLNLGDVADGVAKLPGLHDVDVAVPEAARRGRRGARGGVTGHQTHDERGSASHA